MKLVQLTEVSESSSNNTIVPIKWTKSSREHVFQNSTESTVDLFGVVFNEEHFSFNVFAF